MYILTLRCDSFFEAQIQSRSVLPASWKCSTFSELENFERSSVMHSGNLYNISFQLTFNIQRANDSSLLLEGWHHKWHSWRTNQDDNPNI